MQEPNEQSAKWVWLREIWPKIKWFDIAPDSFLQIVFIFSFNS